MWSFRSLASRHYQPLHQLEISMQKNFQKKAFSLLELSIVILVISILIVGSMTSSVVALNNAKYKVTRDRMAEIYKAMGNYLLTNKALPCPASLKDLKSSSASYGTAGTTNGSNICNDGDGVYAGGTSAAFAYGMVPVQTLGLSSDMAEDGFGSKFTYIVANAYAQSSVTTSDSVGFGRAVGTPTMTVRESLGGSSYQPNTTEAIFVIISHGANKYGAFNNNLASQNTASSESDEQANYGSSFSGTSGGTATFASSYIGTSPNSDTFDDVVFYKSRNQMVIDFKAQHLLVCRTGATNNDDYILNGVTFAWPQAYYGQIVSATTTCSAASSDYTTTVTYPTKRCGPLGIWQPGAVNPCTN